MTSSSKKTRTGNTATRKNKTKNEGAQSRNAKSSSQQPTGLRVRAYQVGFGDSFLLTFQYATENKHVLIDFGSVRLPDNAPKDQLMRVAQDIKLVCGTDGLTALVETHRHRDHISGFATDTKNAPGTIIAALHPQLVLHPWTEDPDANPSGQTATSTGSHTQAFVGRLAAMQAFSGRACVEARQLQVRNSAEFKPELRFAGENNLPNDSAVRNLMNMAPAQDHEYLNCGSKTRLASLLPGVKVWVLGPPTLQQSNAIRKETSTNADEFWQLQKSTVTFDHSEYFRGVSEWKGDPPEPYRWFLRRADKVRAQQMLGLVRILDKTMNNTSLILLFQAAGRRFLFPGDAQWENWSYALNQPKLKALLTNVQLYKVGHHGSRNATPKSMWNALKENSDQHLNTLVSTLEGVFGKEESHTEVPRSTLITELENNSEFRTTAGQTALSQDVVFSF
jgi:hypothetical protein